mgnify:CR=1 FL=1
MTEEFIETTEVAKLIRKQLKRHFPGTKFSVRTQPGSSIRIRWTDGPAERVVHRVVRQFSGATFDSTIDLKKRKVSYLLPDGSAMLADAPGTTENAGVIPAEKHAAPHPDARLVRFMCDFIFCYREISEQYVERCREIWENLDIDTACEIYNSRYFPKWPGDEDDGWRLAMYLSEGAPPSRGDD